MHITNLNEIQLNDWQWLRVLLQVGIHQCFIAVNSAHFLKKWLLHFVVLIYGSINTIASITFTLRKNAFFNKKKTKLYKLNRRSMTMVDILLKYHVITIFQSDIYQNIWIIIVLNYCAKMEQYHKMGWLGLLEWLTWTKLGLKKVHLTLIQSNLP